LTLTSQIRGRNHIAREAWCLAIPASRPMQTIIVTIVAVSATLGGEFAAVSTREENEA